MSYLRLTASRFATGLKAQGWGVPPLDVPRTLYQLTEFLRVGCGHDDACVYRGCYWGWARKTRGCVQGQGVGRSHSRCQLPTKAAMSDDEDVP
jgi:hypothetical protein